MQTRINVEVDSYDVAASLVVNMQPDDLVAFVKQLDDIAADWGITQALYKYFAAEVAKLDFEE